ncbi:Phytochrome, two-component sensor histidine kinase [Mycobacterium marinum str. Europe]|nr:Phytochrome, two-component sensor histidine kinase [Mycobacterium marinum str. Europe]
MLERRHADQLDERGIEYIGFAVDGAKRMQFLINDLLSFSRVDPSTSCSSKTIPGTNSSPGRRSSTTRRGWITSISGASTSGAPA